MNNQNNPEFKVTTGPLPSSRKIYVEGSRSDIQVPMREIDLHPSAGEPPVPVYDTSGPYTDPAISTNIYEGLPRLRTQWIKERGDRVLPSNEQFYVVRKCGEAGDA